MIHRVKGGGGGLPVVRGYDFPHHAQPFPHLVLSLFDSPVSLSLIVIVMVAIVVVVGEGRWGVRGG